MNSKHIKSKSRSRSRKSGRRKLSKYLQGSTNTLEDLKNVNTDNFIKKEMENHSRENSLNGK